MGALHTIKNMLAPRSIDGLRADLATAEAAHKAASEAWSEDETAARWKIAEDYEREVKQLRARLDRAERIERETAAKVAEAERARQEAELAETMQRIESIDAFAAEQAALSVEDHRRLCGRLEAIELRVQARIEDTRRAEALARALGRHVEVRDYNRQNIINLCKHEVQKASHARNEERRIREDAAELVATRWLT